MKGNKGLDEEDERVVSESEQDMEVQDAEMVKDLALAVRLIGEKRRKKRVEREKEKVRAEEREDKRAG